MILLAGLLAGIMHVITGPDHVAAIAPYSVEGRNRAWRVGFSWGVGHAGGVVLVAVLSLALRGLLPIDRLSDFSERLVGIVLICIGLWSLRSAITGIVHTHPHRHGSHQHEHIHVHLDGNSTEIEKPHVHTHAAFAVGTLHGFAGSSHLFGVVPALALPSNLLAGIYLVGFGVGTVAAMTSASWLLGGLLAKHGMPGSRGHRTLKGVCGAAATVVGCIWIVHPL